MEVLFFALQHILLLICISVNCVFDYSQLWLGDTINHMQMPDAQKLAAKLCEQLAAYPAIKSHSCIGIERGGMLLARWLHQELDMQGHLGSLNISFHRDDLNYKGLEDKQPHLQPSNIPFVTDGCKLLVVDDVFMSGRTMRAALNEIFDFGRPQVIKFACLIDLGTHELPIRPDFVATNLKLATDQRIEFSHNSAGGFQLTLENTKLPATTAMQS